MGDFDFNNKQKAVADENRKPVKPQTIPPKTVAVIMAALKMFIQNEKYDFKILGIKPVHSADVNLWGVTGRLANMNRYNRKVW